MNQHFEMVSARQLRPFGWAVLVWGMAGSALSYFLAPEPLQPQALLWWAVFFGFSVLDLLVLAGLVGAMLAGPPSGDKIRWGVRLGFLGFIKMGLLILGAILLMGNRGIPNSSLLSGLGTLIVVPLLGGGLWSFAPSSNGKP